VLAKILAALLLLGVAPGERADRLAGEVAEVARFSPIAGLGPERTGLLLVALVSAESDWRESVEQCEVVGPAREIGLTQLLEGPSRAGLGREAICASSKIQLALGLRRLRAARACGPDVLDMLVGYQRGYCGGQMTKGAHRAYSAFRRIGGER
jgi:hypothetical protein